MTEVYVGQIMLSGFMFPPKGFAACNGATLSIQQNAALFALLGVTYGGNGTINFMLPDMRGRTPIGMGSSFDPNWNPTPYPIGTPGGTEQVTLNSDSMPLHNHSVNATTATGSAKNPSTGLYGPTASESLYANANTNQVPLSAQTIGSAGASTPHDNMQPFLTINFSIALTGIFPART